MLLLFHFLPVLLFITLYVGSGLYFAYLGVEHAFYQVSPTVAIIPALVMGWIMQKGSTQVRMNLFLDGIRHRDIITMCIVFILAGAFSVVTKSIGSVDATVTMTLSLVPEHFLLVGVFIAAACIATAIGSSMGTIATLAPLAAGLAEQGAFPISLGVATVVGGAMFGDNLSMISDTTIAAVVSQGADFRKKLKLNACVAIIAATLTIGLLLFMHTTTTHIVHNPYSFILIIPYFFLLLLATCGINVFVVLVSSLCVAGAIGMIYADYSLVHFCKDSATGFASMQEIMLLSLLVGGLSGLMNRGIALLSAKLSGKAHDARGIRGVQFIIAGLVSLFDLLLANNTIAIIFSGEVAKDLAQKYRLPPHYSAAWLDIFSCVFQGIIPYGAQVLLASSIANVSPLVIMGQVYYCYILGAVACAYIFFRKNVEYSVEYVENK
jgi:Na+/H+ antiporter NhaC